MSSGAIRRLMRDRGFGFIEVADGIALFFHSSEVQGVPFNLLKEGQSVNFEVRLGPKGLQANNVKLMPKEDDPRWGKDSPHSLLATTKTRGTSNPSLRFILSRW